jgi:hypothetical protein
MTPFYGLAYELGVVEFLHSLVEIPLQEKDD